MNNFWPGFSESYVGDFLSGSAPSPTPSRPLDEAGARAARDTIENFLEFLSGLSPFEYPCLETYQAFEHERLAAFNLMLSAGDAQLQSRLNDELFGSENDTNHAANLSHLCSHLSHIKPAGSGTKAAIAAVQEALGHPNGPETVGNDFVKLNDYRIALRPYVDRHFGFVAELLRPYQGAAKLTSQQLASVLDATIGQVLGHERRGWQAVVHQTAPNVFVNLHDHTVTIPADRQYSSEHARALAIHEVGVHVLRAYHGAASPEPLAGIGLPGYGPTEEAFGVLLGNAPKASYHQINSLIPFAVIAYAQNQPEPSFREVHEFATNLIISLANPTNTTLALRRPEFARSAFSRSIRVLRLGQPGLIERSTTKYWRGQLLIAKYFDTHEVTDSTISEFLLGKYDCLNPAQLKLIKSHQA